MVLGGQLTDDVAGKLRQPAERLEADIVLHERRKLEPQILFEQFHQDIDFASRTFPVLNGERVERQNGNVEPSASLHDFSNGSDPRPVSFDTRQPAPFRPSTIAVHDDGDMGGEPREVDLPEELSFDGAFFGRIQNILAAHG